MIEVFKTNVTQPSIAARICNQIPLYFPGSRANFDLSDCDRILRIQSSEPIWVPTLLAVLQHLGCYAEVLPDVIPETGIIGPQPSAHGCICCDSEWATAPLSS